MDAQRKAVETIPVDEGLIRSTTQALADAQTEMAIQQARLRSEIFALLTPDQQAQARKLQAERNPASAAATPARTAAAEVGRVLGPAGAPGPKGPGLLFHVVHQKVQPRSARVLPRRLSPAKQTRAR